jgi:hypothetical protein
LLDNVFYRNRDFNDVGLPTLMPCLLYILYAGYDLGLNSYALLRLLISNMCSISPKLKNLKPGGSSRRPWEVTLQYPPSFMQLGP